MTQKVSVLIKKSALIFDKYANQLLAPHHLTISQFRILMILYKSPDCTIRQLTGKRGRIVMRTVIITGGNSGLGRKTAEKIAKNKEYAVILACRNMEKAKQAENEIKTATGNQNVASMRLNTASLASVRKFAGD